jgi:hypothetical protein
VHLTRRIVRLAAAACASVVLAVAANACGGSGSASTGTTAASDEAAIRGVISQYQDAIRAKDDATFCSLVTAAYRRRSGQASGHCSLPPFTPTFANIIARAKVADVAVSGGTAIAKLGSPGGSIRLEKVSDEWEISSDVRP